jgi:hypothetical protein
MLQAETQAAITAETFHCHLQVLEQSTNKQVVAVETAVLEE